ncbi:unnamed protein product [Microthlaspi erraticum]|uniref:Uncharacterized protein n=1 Tax=Microthlaspi erraticum TaxID=1685480 RepID=A0A6D2IAR5_9BRAS|nr:unnamed protein product [Microthlaspi erraticum]CAA7023213.1 unnamed protein product [Microthlaspi erraticum]
MDQGEDMDQREETKLSLSQYDPWVIKKKLTDSDTSVNAKLYLPRQGLEGSIIPLMRQPMVLQMGMANGVEVKVHVIEEGNEADDYTWRLVKSNDGVYYLKGGWGVFAKDKAYQTGDVIGLMWDQSYERFLLHKIVQY